MKIYDISAPIAGRDLKIYTSSYSDEIETESDLNGLKVGFMTGTATKEMVMKHNSKLSIEAVDFHAFSEAAEMLLAGEIDAFILDGVADPLFEGYDLIRSKAIFRPIYTQVSITTGNPELAPFISVIDKYLAAGGVDRMSELYDEGNYEYAKYKLIAWHKQGRNRAQGNKRTDGPHHQHGPNRLYYVG